jgi:diacylglycerol kinase family enzyme
MQSASRSVDDQGRLPLLINRQGGSLRNPQRRRQIEEGIAARRDLLDAHYLRPRELLERLDQLLEQGVERVAVGGGDGTLSAAANRLVHRRTALAALPFGTFNHFAKVVGMPMAPGEALDLALTGKVQAIDLGRVNQRHFLNNAMLGVYPHAVRRRDRHQRIGMPKAAAMGWALLGALYHLPRISLCLEAAQHRQPVDTPFVMVSNNRYVAEPLANMDRDTLNAGRLGIYYTPSPHRRDLLRLALRILAGRLEQGPGLVALTAPSLRLSGRRLRHRIALDGEVMKMHPPLDFASLPGALRVVMGPGRAP